MYNPVQDMGTITSLPKNSPVPLPGESCFSVTIVLISFAYSQIRFNLLFDNNPWQSS